jgi:hypothetical protein
MRAKTRALAAGAPEEAPSYAPSAQERPVLETYLAHYAAKAPRVKIADDGSIAADHPEPAVGQILLMTALGTTDHDFFAGIVRGLGGATLQRGEVDERALNFMLSVVKGIKPRDHVEAMLAAQMAAIHVATLRSAERLAQAHRPPEQEAAERAVTRLARTFATQMEALKRYRGDQNVTVQHVSVSDGGQAIVGNVNQAPRAPDTKRRAKGSRTAAPGAALPELPAIAAPDGADKPTSMLSQVELAPEMVRRARRDAAYSLG